MLCWIFVFPQEVLVTRENFDQMLSDHKYSKRYFKPYKYSWDSWDFFEESSEELPKNWLNYRDSTDFEMYTVWQVKENLDTMDGFRPKILDEYSDNQVWIRNFSKHGYDHYVAATQPSPNLSNLDLAYVAYLLDIDYRGQTRRETFDLIKERINKEFHLESFEKKNINKKILIKKVKTQNTEESTPGKKKCLGKTKKGTQCQREPKSGQQYCYQHQI